MFGWQKDAVKDASILCQNFIYLKYRDSDRKNCFRKNKGIAS